MKATPLIGVLYQQYTVWVKISGNSGNQLCDVTRGTKAARPAASGFFFVFFNPFASLPERRVPPQTD